MAVRFRVKVVGVREAKRAFSNLAKFERYANKGMDRISRRIVKQAQTKYFRRKSPPSVPPIPRKLTSRSRNLRDSIGFTRISPLRREVGTDVVYGPTHEFGDSSRNIPRRPYIRPAVNDILDEGVPELEIFRDIRARARRLGLAR